MPGIGHKLPLPLHILRNGTDGPTGERYDQREHQQPADGTQQKRQQHDARHGVPTDGAVEKDDAIPALRTGVNFIPVGPDGPAGLLDVKPECQLGGFILRDRSDMAHIRTEHPALIIQIRNEVQSGHAHVVIHRFIQKTAPAAGLKGTRRSFGRYARRTGTRFASCGRGGWRIIFRTGKEGSLTAAQIIQEKLGLAGVGDGVEHVQRTENDQQQNRYGDHRRDNKLLLQCANHVMTSSV